MIETHDEIADCARHLVEAFFGGRWQVKARVLSERAGRIMLTRNDMPGLEFEDERPAGKDPRDLKRDPDDMRCDVLRYRLPADNLEFKRDVCTLLATSELRRNLHS